MEASTICSFCAIVKEIVAIGPHYISLISMVSGKIRRVKQVINVEKNASNAAWNKPRTCEKSTENRPGLEASSARHGLMQEAA